MSHAEAEEDSSSSNLGAVIIEDSQPLLDYRYDGTSKEQDSDFDRLSEQSPSDSSKRSLSWRPTQLSISTLTNLTLLIFIIISLVVFSSSIQSQLSQLLRLQPSGRLAQIEGTKPSKSTWKLDQINSLVVFGDSYSAEVELGYFLDHFEHQAKVEWKTRINSETAIGGYVWPRWASWYTEADVFNYAVGGAVCSTQITPHAGALGIQEHEIVSYLADAAQSKHHVNPMIEVSSETTVYAIFIGTNGLGNGGFLTQGQIPGMVLDDWTGCIFQAFDRLYQSGGRNFVLMNVVPLEHSPTFNSIENGGVAKGAYWNDKPQDTRSIAIHTEQIVASANHALKYQAAYEMQISRRYPGARLAYFDVHKLFSDIIDDPERFLNGTAKPEVTDSCVSCKTGECKTCTSRDSYLWFDELHPSEQTSRLIAKEFKSILEGNGTYAEYWETPT